MSTETIDTCPAASWQSLPFLKSPEPASKFYDLQDWDTKEVKDYALDKLVQIVPSLTFLGLSLGFLLIFLLWRVLHACAVACCCQERWTLKRDTTDPGSVLYGRLMKGLKAVMLVFGLATVAVAIAGMALDDKGLVQGAWQEIQYASDYAEQLAVHADNILGNATEAMSLIGTTSAPNSQLARFARDYVQPIVDEAQDVPSLIREQTVQRADDIRGDLEDPSNHYWGVAYKVILGIYGLVILVTLLYILCVFLSCPAGIAIFLLLSVLVSALCFVLTVVLAFGMTVPNDLCPAVEGLVLHNIGGRWQPLASYFFFGNGTSVKSLLADANVVDVRTLDAQLLQARQEINSTIGRLGSDPQVATLQQVDLSLVAANTSMYGLLADVDYTKLSPVYASIKGYACCTVPDSFAKLWALWTACGWLLLAMCHVGIVLLAQLDKLPQAGCCCACARMRAEHAHGTAKVADMEKHTLPPAQFAARDSAYAGQTP